MSVSTIKQLEQYISYCSVKNKVLDENISNIGTENYKRKDVNFNDLFQQNCSGLLKTTNDKHFGNMASNDDVSYDVARDNDPNIASGINNVDIEKEMSELAENSINFKFASKKIGEYYKNIQNVIKGTNS
jgi:flagellar basal-body rod protein FlgB